MVVGEMPEGVDFLVIGGGPGGYVAALAAARRGREVVLVDIAGEAGLGGVCVTVGCIPSKALIEFADRVHSADVWRARGISTEPGKVVMNEFQSWKSSVVGALNGGVRSLLADAAVRVVPGYFRFTRPDQGVVEQEGRPPMHLRFRHCVLATGSRPAPVEGIHVDGARVLDSTGVLALSELPESVAVIGGGYIGVELGTALAKLGADVTIVEMAPALLNSMGAEPGRAVRRQLTRLGVSVLTGARVLYDDGKRLYLDTAEGQVDIEVDVVVAAAGRQPNTDDIGLESIGVVADERGLLPVAANRLLTPTVAAIGDITAGPALAHKASAEAHVAVDALCGETVVFDPLTISAVVFSDPEIAVTGLTEQQAVEIGYDARVAAFPFSASGRARTLGAEAGSARWVYDVPTGVVLGARVIGAHASELIAEATMAIEMGASLADVAATIHAHPTLSETLAEAAMVGLGQPLHLPDR